MKTKCILPALILGSIGFLHAQNGASKTTVHIKKVEIVNGVKTEKDTTYVSDDAPLEDEIQGLNPETMKGNINMRIIHTGDSAEKKLFITLNDSCIRHKTINKVIVLNDDPSAQAWQMNTSQNPITLPNGKTLDQVMAESEVNTPMTADKFLIKRLGKCDATQAEIDSVLESITIYVTGMSACNKKPEESKALKLKPSTQGLNNLVILPNPNNGKFSIRFQSKQKEDVELDILTQEGKSIYRDSLKSKTGVFEKEIDISEHPKGIYMVRVSQSGLTQVRKIVLE